MKKRNLSQKLTLKKETISNLNEVRGGGDRSSGARMAEPEVQTVGCTWVMCPVEV